MVGNKYTYTDRETHTRQTGALSDDDVRSMYARIEYSSLSIYTLIRLLP